MNQNNPQAPAADSVKNAIRELLYQKGKSTNENTVLWPAVIAAILCSAVVPLITLIVLPLLGIEPTLAITVPCTLILTLLFMGLLYKSMRESALRSSGGIQTKFQKECDLKATQLTARIQDGNIENTYKADMGIDEATHAEIHQLLAKGVSPTSTPEESDQYTL